MANPVTGTGGTKRDKCPGTSSGHNRDKPGHPPKGGVPMSREPVPSAVRTTPMSRTPGGICKTGLFSTPHRRGRPDITLIQFLPRARARRITAPLLFLGSPPRIDRVPSASTHRLWSRRHTARLEPRHADGGTRWNADVAEVGKFLYSFFSPALRRPSSTIPTGLVRSTNLIVRLGLNFSASAKAVFASSVLPASAYAAASSR
jgi:hypothetical protein